ncbi:MULTISPECIES: hypothetical protein [unclassified Marinovum]
MTRMLAPVLFLTASPALAHSGAHLHPHGAGNWLTVALALGLVAVAATLMVLRK